MTRMTAMAVAVALLLAGCADPGTQGEAAAPTGRPVAPVESGSGGAGRPSDPQAEFGVRTFARAPSGLDLEVGGVACTASSGAAVVRFRSPARVVLPDTGEGMRVVCAGGGRAGEAFVEARQAFATGGWRAAPSLGISLGSGGRVGTGIGVGLSPVAVPAGVTYDDVRVTLR
jgi:hypothetical protein